MPTDGGRAEGEGARSGGRGEWHGGGGWGPPWARGQAGWGSRRPPWWPDGEAWPPEGAEGWRVARRRFARRAAVFGLGFVLVFALVVGVVVSAFTSLLAGHPGGGVFLGVVLVLSLVGAWRGGRAFRRAAAPLGELVEASARVESGELGVQVAERGLREVRSLTRAFNAMSARLASTEAERRRLLADVSHELRTPLTVIQGNVEGMLDGLYPADRAHLERILAETQQLERLIDDLRTLSLAETGGLSLDREPTDLATLVSEVVAAFKPQADAGAIELTAEVADDVPELDVDPRRIRQVVANLLSNAVRHTPAGGRVTLSLARDGERVAVSVADTGEGMEPEAAARAFDRFWRSPGSPGAGLGLAIVRDLVEAHGGSVELRTARGEGVLVRCLLPGGGGHATS